jgi:hypothetical protein
MEKEFIPYELAVKLKALGFNEPCFAFFNGIHLSFSRFDTLGELLDIGKCIEAPTYSQAFRWFRDKYNIHIRIEKYDETKWWANWGSWTSEVYDSYEGAEEICLEKLIEIVENEKTL